MPAWVQTGFHDYAKRLPAHLAVDVREIPLNTRTKSASPDRLIAREATAMLDAIPTNAHVVALDLTGKSYSSEGLSLQLARWMSLGKPLATVIGGPEGLHDSVLARADERWCLSPLTLPHPLVRLLWIEQLYRAWTLTQGHPYHK